jgi:hypothetical protein
MFERYQKSIKLNKCWILNPADLDTLDSLTILYSAFTRGSGSIRASFHMPKPMCLTWLMEFIIIALITCLCDYLLYISLIQRSQDQESDLSRWTRFRESECCIIPAFFDLDTSEARGQVACSMLCKYYVVEWVGFACLVKSGLSGLRKSKSEGKGAFLFFSVWVRSCIQLSNSLSAFLVPASSFVIRDSGLDFIYYPTPSICICATCNCSLVWNAGKSTYSFFILIFLKSMSLRTWSTFFFLKPRL